MSEVIYQSWDTLDKFFGIIDTDVQRPVNILNERGIPATDKNYNKSLEDEKGFAADDLVTQFAGMNVTVSRDEALQLLNP
jgi:hypothetical protein